MSDVLLLQKQESRLGHYGKMNPGHTQKIPIPRTPHSAFIYSRFYHVYQEMIVLTFPFIHNHSECFTTLLRETLPRKEGNTLMMPLGDRELYSNAPLKTVYRGKYGDKGFWGEAHKSESEREDGRGPGDSLRGRKGFSKEGRAAGSSEQRRTCQWFHLSPIG